MNSCTWCGTTARRTVTAFWSPDVHLCPSCCTVAQATFDRSLWPKPGVSAKTLRDRLIAQRSPTHTSPDREAARQAARRVLARLAQRERTPQPAPPKRPRPAVS